MKFFKLNNILTTQERFSSIFNAISFLFDRNNIEKYNLPGLKSNINSDLEFIGFTILDYSIMSLFKKSIGEPLTLNIEVKGILSSLNLINKDETVDNDIKALSMKMISFLPIEYNDKLVNLPILGAVTDIEIIEI